LLLLQECKYRPYEKEIDAEKFSALLTAIRLDNLCTHAYTPLGL
jgi:hypothetical protein